MAHRIVPAVLLVLVESSIQVGSLEAQLICRCEDPKEFGSCITGTVDYPGDFPGSAAVVPTQDAAGDDVVYVFVADLYNGFTYRYSVPPNEVLKPTTPHEALFSLGGLQATSGITYDPVDGSLYWAIEDKVFRSDVDLTEKEQLGAQNPDLPTLLKDRLGLSTKGVLGGITYHPARSNGETRVFWTVDIVNDIYFEFFATKDEKGGWTVGLSEENGEPTHFRNPLLSPFGGGAYGTGITYVQAAGRSYFDLPIGRLIDANAVQVARVHADADSEGRFQIGDLSGYRYPISAAAGKTNLISGIGHWPSTCGGANHTELLLDIVQPGLGKSRILQVSADDPTATNLASFLAVASGNNVNLSWDAPGPYSKLEITREGVPLSVPPAPFAVATIPPPAQDPGGVVDKNVGDGLYEYTAQVTTPAGVKLHPVKTRVVVGQGSIAAAAIDITVTAAGIVQDSRKLNVSSIDVTYPDPKKVSAGWLFWQGTTWGVVEKATDGASGSTTLILDRTIGVKAGPAQLRRPQTFPIPTDDLFAITYIDSLSQVLVADRFTGNAFVLEEKLVIARAAGAPATDTAAPEAATYSLYQGSDVNPRAVLPLNQNDRIGFKRTGTPPVLTAVAGSREIPIADDDSYWKIDLHPKSTFAGPFVRDARTGGRTTGVTYAPDTHRLLWVVETRTGSYLQATDLAGVLVGPRVPIRVPINLRRVPEIGDLSYDAVRKEIWGIDRANMVAFSFDASGLLKGNSNIVQLTAKLASGPERDFGGALAVIDSTDQSLVIDCSVGDRTSPETPANLVRLSYDRSGAAGDLSVPGTQLLDLDLRSILEAEEIGGLAAHRENPVGGVDVDYRFVVGIDTRTVYRLVMNSGLRGKEFKRGDVNVDDAFNISDPLAILNYLFLSRPIKCADAADLDDNEAVDVSDAISLFAYLFLPAGKAPPAPFPACGRDFDPPLICEESACR